MNRFPPDQVIRVCTALIQSGRQSGADLSESFFYRGLAYRTQGDYARAIADFSEAIRLNPQYAEAYFWRGYDYHTLRDHARAIADFSQLILLEPQNPAAYSNRANAYQELGDHIRAAADRAEFCRLNGPSYPVCPR